MIPSAHTIPQEEKIISTRNLKFTYEGGVEALHGLNLDIRHGDYLAIVGGNGSGKTTLAKTLNGLLRPTSGTVFVKGKSASEQKVAELAKIVGYAFQNPDHQLFCSSVEDEVRFGPENLGYSDNEVRENVDRAIEAMKLTDVRALPPLSLRLGQRRRVSIASVIAMNPQVLILDEPTTGLDAGESQDLLDRLKLLNSEGKTIILITHDMRVVAEHARRVIVMANGRMLLDSDCRGVFSDLAILGESSLEPPAVSRLAHRLAKYGIPQDVVSAEEIVFQLMRAGGGR